MCGQRLCLASPLNSFSPTAAFIKTLQMLQVSLCFHSTENIPLPEWIVEESRVNPDVFFTASSSACHVRRKASQPGSLD
jgi:hypothetical protein